MNGQKSGFTLAELLIALGILAVIATFTIPKVLNSQQNSQRNAIFKETVAALNGALHTGLLKGEVADSNFGTYMMTHLNAVKICNTNATTQGCWHPNTDPAGQGVVPGLILHNGACITGLDDASSGSGADTLAVDWNCLGEPNEEGKDVLRLRAFFDDTSTSDRVGTVYTQTPGSASHNLWLEIFNN